MAAVQSGALPVFVDARADAEIDAALRLVADTNLQVWVCTPNQLRPFADRFLQQQVGVVVPPTVQTTYEWYFHDLVQAHRTGVRLLLAGDGGTSLRTTASALVGAGLDRASGRRLLMIDAAKYLAHGQTIGLAAGAHADLIVWSADPLDLSSQLLWHSRGEQ